MEDGAILYEVVREHVELHGSGAERKGLCPFHDDTNPSLSVNVETGLWHCFGCGRGGDVFTFIMEAEHCDFSEARKVIAERFRLDLPVSPVDDVEMKARLLLRKVFTDLKAQYAGSPGEEYMVSRGIQGVSEIGYVRSAQDLQIEAPREVVEAAGLTLPASAWHSRVVFPITYRHQIVQFCMRATQAGDEPKYLYLAKRPRIVWGSDEVRGRAEFGVTEGIISALSLPIPAVALLGTAYKSDQVFPLLGEGHDRRILLCLDDDPAGRDCILRFSSEAQAHGFTVRVCRAWPDPNELLQSQGPEGVAAALRDGQYPLEFLRQEGIRPEIPQALVLATPGNGHTPRAPGLVVYQLDDGIATEV